MSELVKAQPEIKRTCDDFKSSAATATKKQKVSSSLAATSTTEARKKIDDVLFILGDGEIRIPYELVKNLSYFQSEKSYSSHQQTERNQQTLILNLKNPYSVSGMEHFKSFLKSQNPKCMDLEVNQGQQVYNIIEIIYLANFFEDQEYTNYILADFENQISSLTMEDRLSILHEINNISSDILKKFYDLLLNQTKKIDFTSDNQLNVSLLPQSVKAVTFKSPGYQENLNDLPQSVKAVAFESPEYQENLNDLPESVQIVRFDSKEYEKKLNNLPESVQIVRFNYQISKETFSKLPNSIKELGINHHTDEETFRNLPEHIKRLECHYNVPEGFQLPLTTIFSHHLNLEFSYKLYL